MDDFTEYLVKRQPTAKSAALKVLIVVASIVLAIVLMIVCAAIKQIAFLGLLLAVGAIYGGWLLVRNQNLEFEYIVTGGDMDVDKIIARSRRKRLLSCKFRSIEIMAPATEAYRREMEAPGIKTRIDASSGNPADTYFIKFEGGEKLGMTLLLFSPSDRIIQDIKNIVPRKVMTA